MKFTALVWFSPIDVALIEEGIDLPPSLAIDLYTSCSQSTVDVSSHVVDQGVCAPRVIDANNGSSRFALLSFFTDFDGLVHNFTGINIS
ncbi:hypothetical protein Ancab_005904 [Ancistrocladus abbreviatus]